jgi:hypothetical protein
VEEEEEDVVSSSASVLRRPRQGAKRRDDVALICVVRRCSKEEETGPRPSSLISLGSRGGRLADGGEQAASCAARVTHVPPAGDEAEGRGGMPTVALVTHTHTRTRQV